MKGVCRANRRRGALQLLEYLANFFVYLNHASFFFFRPLLPPRKLLQTMPNVLLNAEEPLFRI